MLRNIARVAVVWFLAVTVFAATLLATAHSLHRQLHLKSTTPAHLCLVCLLSGGEVTGPAASSVCVAPAPVGFAPPFAAPDVYLSSFDHTLPFGRAPPWS